MTHVINKIRQLGIGFADIIALLRAWFKFSSAALSLFGGSLGGKTTKKLIINPIQTVIVCFHCEWFCCVDSTSPE